MEKNKRLGCLGSGKGNSTDIILNLKKNKGDASSPFFVSLIDSINGFKTVYIPQGKDFLGWKHLLQSLLWVLDMNSGNNQVTIRRKVLNEKVVSGVVSQTKIEELRDESVVMISNREVDNWSRVGGWFQQTLKLSYMSNVTIVTRKRALLELQNRYEQS